MTKRFAQVAVVLVALCGWSACASPMLILIPLSGSISGSANQIIGWGFSIVNDTSDWLLITNSYFCNTGGDPNFTDCTTPGVGPTSFGPQFGIYTDYIAANVTVVPATSTIGPTAFSPGNPGSGVGEYKVNGNAPFGSMDVGNLFVTYNTFTGDPFDGGDPNPNDPGNLQMSAAAKVTVTTVPEPASFGLAGGALLLLGVLGSRRKRV